MPLTQTVERGAVVATAGVELVIEQCGKCQCVFAMPKNLHDRARADSNVNFYCPNGHCRCYRETLREKLARQEKETRLARGNATFWQDQHDAAGRSLAATRGHLTRVKNRVAKGVCPCCKRTFKDLARHMHSKHPGYGGEKGD